MESRITSSNALVTILRNKRYLATALVFFSMNVIFSTWAIYIPTIKEKLSINEGEIGFAIFFMALGTFIMLFTAPLLISKLGVGKATAYGGIVMFIMILIPFLAPNYFILCLGLLFVGTALGFTDIAMNTLVTELEKRDDVHVMSAKHGFFSLGGMIGAGVGTLFLPYVEIPIYHALVVVGLCLIVHLFLMHNYWSVVADAIEKMQFSFKQFRPLIWLGIIGFFVMASEGAIVDWSALYLENVSNAPEVYIGLGLTAFSLTMALGRFAGDGISSRFGARSIMIVGNMLGVVGFVFILMESTMLAILGFGLVGLGFSTIVPELFRLGGKTKGVDSAQGVSFIAGSGFAGFLLGPVFLGLLADLSSLKLSFIALLCFTIIALASSLKVTTKSR
ncbi:MFS transporter [Ascidiimonas sp. W6]|uniref:MFS transporter n=1 Tax=Ascidiimonas meishanensis TaxID=3128903 RepID=UPI0030ED2F8C